MKETSTMGESGSIGSGGSKSATISRPPASKGSKVQSNSAVKKSTSKVGSTANKPAAKNPQEVSNISKDARQADKPNAMAEGITKNWKEKGLETSDGNKLGKYTKTGEGTIEKELLKKGFTLKDIYTKDKQGRTLADQVAQANGIKNQKAIADGKELKLPQRPGAQGMSSADLKPGESKAIQATNGENSSKVTQTKDAQGVTHTENRGSSQGNTATIRQQTDGVATTSVAPIENGTQSNTVQHSPNNQAIDQTTVRAQDGKVSTLYQDIDGKKNSVAERTDGGLKITNPDGQGRGNQTTIPLGPQSGLQSIAQKADELGGSVFPNFFKPQQVTGADAPIGQIGSVDGAQQRDGSSSYNVRQADGNVKQVGQTASGRVLGAVQAVEETASNAWNGIKNFFGGGSSSPNAGIPAEQIFSPSGTII